MATNRVIRLAESKNMIANDIKKKIVSMFGDSSANGICCEIERFITRFTEYYKHEPEERIIRATIILSEGSLQKLRHFLDGAFKDYRDILSWAEYDKNGTRIHDYNQPFQ